MPTAVAAAPKTFLPQKSYFPLWKNGFETWHINVFVFQLIAANLYLIRSGAIDRPDPGSMPIDEVLDPSKNPVFRTMLLTTVALFAKTHAVMWAQVWLGCKNNSFSKNPYDTATGDPSVAPRTTEQDFAKTTMHHIHGNDLENIPYTLALHLLLVLVQPTAEAARLIMVTYVVVRYVHTFWYAFYGSHEVRATLFSVNCWANYAAVCQILSACKVI